MTPRGNSVKVALEDLINDLARSLAKLDPFAMSDMVKRTYERLKKHPGKREHHIERKLRSLFFGSTGLLAYCDSKEPPIRRT